MSKPYGKVAIITRTKNRNLLLERALQSVDAQSYKDYIHVILNDGGDSKALETLLKKYPNKNRLVIHNKQSVGHTKALVQAIKSCDGEYISILDDDDTWHKDRLRLAINYMDKNKSLGSVSSMAKVYEEIKDNAITETSRHKYLEDEEYISLYKQCLDNYLSNGCFIYRRDIYIDLGGYDETLAVAEDWDFGIRFLLNYDVDFVESNHPLVNYHLRESQSGELGNSVFDGIDIHKSALNKIRNKYLREDLNNNKSLGLGYIMNDLALRRSEKQESNRLQAENVVRLEGHINKTTSDIAEEVKKVEEKITSNLIMPKIKRRIGR